MTLENEIILVTGGMGLLGKAIVVDIRKRGGQALCADINCETSTENNTVYLDVTQQEMISTGIANLEKQYGKITGLVHCSYPRTPDWGTPFEDVPLESWRENVDMQLTSCFSLCQAVLPWMVTRGYGSIVLIGSIYGVVGNDFSLYADYGGTSPVAYSAVKGGVINLTRYLASYYGDRGIRVNCVSPGGIKDEKKQDHRFIKRFEDKVPLKRMGTPEDIAPAVSFLLSKDASYITGHNLLVDGGWTII